MPTPATARPLPVTDGPDGVTVRVRLTPKAKRNHVLGLIDDSEGGTLLRVGVTAAPERGKANAALIGLLAKEWGVAKSHIRVVQGATERRKMLHIAGDTATLSAHLRAWIEGLDG